MNEFIDAIEDWDYDKVLEMLKNGADPNAVDDCVVIQDYYY